MKSQIKNAMKYGKFNNKDVILRFDENIITEITDKNENKIKYSIIEKIALGKAAVYIYIGALQAFIIPFWVFESEQQKVDFLDFINQKNFK